MTRASHLVSDQADFVGRAHDLGRLAEFVAGEERLLTLTGPGGIGKTRLALAFGSAEVARGTGYVPCALAGARTVEDACDALSRAAGFVGDDAGRALAARADVLVLLDGFDGLVEHAEATISRWLLAAPEARFLVTSRERLKIPGEAVHEVGPLGRDRSGDALSEAVELFVRVARRARGTYTLDPAEAPFVEAIVRELDGVPLAIELAAPRMAIMGARALLHRLGTLGHLEAAIESSYATLLAHEKEAFEQSSVFRGGFSVEAAEAVLELPEGAPSILDAIQSLRDKSLLTASLEEGSGEVRLDMLGSLRAFAEGKLERSGKREAARTRHDRYFTALSLAFARQGTASARARIVAERANLFAAVERVVERRPLTVRTAEPALRILVCLGRALPNDGPVAAYRALIAGTIEATRDSGADPLLQAEALIVRGAHARAEGRLPAAGRDLVQALSIANARADRGLMARAILELGSALEDRGESESAREHYERALAAFEELGPPSEAADALGRLGQLLARTDRETLARPLLERAAATHRALGHEAAEARDLALLGVLDLDRGLYDDARRTLDASLALSKRASDPRGEVLALGLSGFALLAAGDLSAARPVIADASARAAEVGLSTAAGFFTGLLGLIAREASRSAESYALLGAAVDALRSPDPATASVFEAQRAAADADVGRGEAALVALERADRNAAEHGISRAAPVALRAEVIRCILALSRAHLDCDAGPRALEAAEPLSQRSALVRIAARLLARRAAGAAESEPPPPDSALVVGADAQWFRPPVHPASAEHVRLERRRPLARLLARLVAERLARPGASLAWDELLQAAWPNERVMATAGAHRVRVAVSTLRKLGLKDLLETTEAGYRLRPDVETVSVSA